MRHACNEKRQTTPTDVCEQPNKNKIKTLGEKETYKYLGILEADTINNIKNRKKNNSMNVLSD